jgi:hypothetical protein
MAAHAGGAFPGLTDYTNYNGYNLRWVSQVHRALLDEGWSQSGTGECFIFICVFCCFAFLFVFAHFLHVIIQHLNFPFKFPSQQLRRAWRHSDFQH